MGDMQSKETSELARLTYATESLRKGFVQSQGVGTLITVENLFATKR